MIKIKPLNRESISDDDAPIIRKEAQEENALAKYNKALKLQCSGDYEEAESLLQSLIDVDTPQIENRGGLPKALSSLKYSCVLNIGTIHNGLGNKQKALDYFVQASELDTTDVTLWFKIGSLALELDHFKQSAYAFSKGLECNKRHWPSLDKLIMLLYAMRDTVSCLHYISRALQLDSDYIRGLMLRKRIYENNPGTRDYYQLCNPDYIYDPPLNTEFDEIEGKELENECNEVFKRIRDIEIELESKPLPVIDISKPLEEFSWISLGETIIHMHNYIAEEKLSYICRVNLSENIKSKLEDLSEKIEVSEETKNKTIEKDEEIINISYDKICENEKDDKMDVDNVEHESDVASEIPDVSDDTETEEKNSLNDTEMEVEEENVFPNHNSKSNSQEDPRSIRSSLDEDSEKQKKSESGKEGGETSDKNETSDKIEGREESPEKLKSRTQNRKRRNSLSFLQPWAWHSKKKSTRRMGKNDKDVSIEGALRKIIPNNLLPDGLKCDKYRELNSLQQDDSLNTMDLYKLFVDDNKKMIEFDSKIVVDKSALKLYFGTQEEIDDVKRFWKHDFERCDIMVLLEKFVTILATMWDLQWPQKLKNIYTKAYEMYREHLDHPDFFGGDTEFNDLRIDTKITLLYGELIFDEVQDLQSKNLSLSEIKQLPCQSLSLMELVCTRKTDWGEEYLKINLRLYWLKANIYMVENKNDTAIRPLQAITYFITKFTENINNYYLFLPNCVHNSIITLYSAEKLLQSLEMVQKLGTVEKLYENQCYKEVISILQDSFYLKNTSRHQTNIDRPVQIVMMLHALWLTDRTECFKWTEICIKDSLPMYFKTYAQPDSFEHKRWTLVTVKCMVLMEACIKEESIIVLDCIKDTQVRLVENLTSIICHQLNSKSMDVKSKIPLASVKPWILLHYVLQREEHRIQARRRNVRHCKKSDNSDDEEELNTSSERKSTDSEEDDDNDVPSSVQILFTAHEFLGKRGWCLESGGEVLLFLVDMILYRVNAPIFEGIREKIETHIEQAFFCLYQHPSKKNKVSRFLQDHNVDPLPLTWKHAQQLYEFYQPKSLPEFDSYRFDSISNEMEQLLLRILALVPSELDPQKILPHVMEYLNGQSDALSASIEFPHKVSAVYYLLGDYYLKQHDPAKGLKYFFLDLCLNPYRLDTWADMALAMASQLETKLNHCEAFKNESEFLDKVKSAQICFKQSLQISSGHALLWIEYGNFVYMGHSFCSRLLKGDTDMFSMEKFEALESQKESMLDTASECFTAANIAWIADPGEHDERWLHHYMLGKIAEKKKQDPGAYLDHYSQAAKLLFENKATCPPKINYSNPQHLSVEALEIHYRTHASILKYLELHEDKPLARSIGKIFQKHLKDCDNGLFSSKPQDSSTENIAKRPVSEPLEQPYAKKQKRTDAGMTEDVTDNGTSKLQISLTENSAKRPASEQLEQLHTKNQKKIDANIAEDVTNVLEEILVRVDNSVKKSDDSKTDIIMVLDSDDDPLTTSIKASNGEQQKIESISPDFYPKLPRIRVKNAQEIMDDLMRKCMADQPDYKSETETDAETDFEKLVEVVKSSTSTENIQKTIENVSSPSRRGSTTSTAATTTTTTTSDSSDSSSSDDSSSSSSDSESSETESNSSKIPENTVLTPEEIKKLMDQCLLSLEQCISRFPQNYKALYRLTHFYLHNKTYKNLQKCRQLMLTEYTCSHGGIVTGLFSDKKFNNFFHGIWRIPTSEIDRPGSFASHMSRCVQLLMQVLRDSDDHKTLLDLCLMLRKTPDPDKIYIRDSERQQLSDQALSICIQLLRGMVKKFQAGKLSIEQPDTSNINPNTQEKDAAPKLILDVYRAYQKIQKHIPNKENVFSGFLTDTYKHYMQNKTPESNSLEAAIKFCQTRKITSRMIVTPINSPSITQMKQQQQQQQQQQQTSSATTSVQSPSPQSSPIQPFKRTAKGLPGRPRGRPPNINKHSPGVKPIKVKDTNFAPPTNMYSWPNMMYSPSMGGNLNSKMALKYMMSKYQEELMRQYSNLCSTQNSVLNSPFNINPMLSNPLNLPQQGLGLPSVGGASSDRKEKSKNKHSTSSGVITNIPIEKKDITNTTARYSKESNKAYYAEASNKKEVPKDISVFKDRPGVSITPIQTLLSNSARNMSAPSSSTPKTLQQKLAERKKQQSKASSSAISSGKSSSKHELAALDIYNQYKKFSIPSKTISFAKPNIPLPPVPHGPKLNIPPKSSSSHFKNLQNSIPSSLTITKAHAQSLPAPIDNRDSGLSISQITSLPSSGMLSVADVNKLMNFRKPTSAPKIKPARKLNDITITPNYRPHEINIEKETQHINKPMSLSITKNDNKKDGGNKGNDRDVEIITIE